jgi:LytS/YehU family sensor histidine kinase
MAYFTDGFFTILPDCQYYRGPLYPLMPLPVIVMLLMVLAGVGKRRKRLSRKTFISFLVAFLPMTVALVVHLFFDVFPLINICIVVSSLSMYSLILSDQMEQDLRHQREIACQRTSIMVLQMRPHFIYNTLMSIYSLCNLDSQKARQVTMDFADYLRRNFNAVASEDTIPFSAELEHTRAYLAVEQAQYEEMLLVEYDTQFTQFRLPPLTLQPIVENAVKHGMDPDADPLRVTIRTWRTDSAIVIHVEDNGSGFEVSTDPESHTALANIRKRLELMCEGKLEITSGDEGGTTVTITIPLRMI